MSSSELLLEIGRKESDKDEIVDRVIGKTELIPEIIEGLNEKKALPETRQGFLPLGRRGMYRGVDILGPIEIWR